MKIKTGDLTGAALDWAVAKAEGWTFSDWHQNDGDWQVWAEKVDADGRGPAGYFPADRRLHFSTNWSQGGLIIEREQIGLVHYTSDLFPEPCLADMDGKIFWGPTPLIAAMRCFVASKLGDQVDIPEELE